MRKVWIRLCFSIFLFSASSAVKLNFFGKEVSHYFITCVRLCLPVVKSMDFFRKEFFLAAEFTQNTEK